MQPVLDYLKRNRTRAEKELCEYVRFPSVSAQPEHASDMRACAEWLVAHCRKIGLDARLCATDGNPVVMAKTPRAKSAPRKRHFMVYGHYDVQPAEPFDLWKSPPFTPTIRGRSLFGRGASDNKGQNLAHLKAVEAYLRTGTELPCDLTFVIEGEEEVGSKSLGEFLQKHRAELQCDAVVVSDTGIPSPKHPALTYALRGIAAFEITVRGPSRDLHSGIFGGSVKNPAMALAQLLAKVHDVDGHVTIPGFYAGVAKLTGFERRQMARVPFNGAAYRKLLGVPELFGEGGFTSDEQRTARYRCVLALMRSADDTRPLLAQGCWEGRIGFKAAGSGGFGYDPYFIPAGFDCTAAELSAEQKNALSHRGAALRALIRRLDSWA